jgi:hypothetical protein
MAGRNIWDCKGRNVHRTMASTENSKTTTPFSLTNERKLPKKPVLSTSRSSPLRSSSEANQPQKSTKTKNPVM